MIEMVEAPPVTPTATARGLGLRTRRGWVFRDVDLEAGPGELVAVTGPAGSGRTSLLLALAGRLKTTDGTVRVAGTAALGHVPGVHEPEPALTVAEHVEERLLLLGKAPRGRRKRSAKAREILRETFYPGDADTLGRDLDAYHAHRLGLTLALMTDPDLIVVVDADVALTADERRALVAALYSTGATVI